MAATDAEEQSRLRRFHEKFIVEERIVPASSKRNLYLIAVVLGVVGVTAFFVILDSISESDGLSVIDSRHLRPIATIGAFAVATILVILVGSCRVYLGYHWPTDVLASLSLSLVVLGAVIAVDTWRTVRVEP